MLLPFVFCQVPYRGKIRRGKVTKFWPGDENFADEFFDDKVVPSIETCF